MAKNKKNCYTVRVEYQNGIPITRLEYVGVESDFLVWYKNVQKRFSSLGKNISFPYYFFPVTEG